MSQAQMVEQSAGDYAVTNGVDRVFHSDDISVFSSGTAFVDLLVTAGAFERMSVLARAFQRVAFLSLVFEVSTYAPTSTGGGYVAAFVADPDDVSRDNSNLLSWLTSQQGSKTTKWWQSTTIVARPARSWYFTSPGVELREYSPGRLILAVDVKASAALGLTIWARWQVRFMKATLEAEPTLLSRTVAVDLYTQAGHQGLFYKQGQTFKDDLATQIPGARVGEVYILPTPVGYLGGDTQAGATFRTAWWIKATSANDLLFCYEKPGSTTKDVAGSEILVIRKGTALELYKEASGEVQGPSGLTSSGAPSETGATQLPDSNASSSNCSLTCGNCSKPACQTSPTQGVIAALCLLLEKLSSTENPELSGRLRTCLSTQSPLSSHQERGIVPNSPSLVLQDQVQSPLGSEWGSLVGDVETLPSPEGEEPAN